MKKKISVYIAADWPRLLLALLVGAALYMGVVDLGSALAGGMLLQTTPGPEEFKRIIEAHEKAIRDALAKMGDVAELKARILELEQKGALRPGALGVGSNQSDALRQALEKSEQVSQLQSMAKRRFKGDTVIELPAAALETKTAILGPVTAGAAALQIPDRASGFIPAATRRLTVRALLQSLPTEAGATQFTRENVFTNNAAVQGAGSSPQELEGQIKAESGITFTLVTAPVVTIAHWLPASEQVLSDVPGLAQFIDTRLVYGLALEEEDFLLNGSAGIADGLLDAAAAFNRSATADTRADQLRRAITQLLLADHVCNGIVVNPVDDEALDLEKDSQGRYLAVKVNGRAWQVPIVSTNAIGAGSWLAGDFTGALVRDRQEATVQVSNSHEDYFKRNLVAIRAEKRLALEIHRPSAFVTGAFHQAGQPG